MREVSDDSDGGSFPILPVMGGGIVGLFALAGGLAWMFRPRYADDGEQDRPFDLGDFVGES